MLDLISRIAASDKSILLSSHILHDVEKLCRNVIIVSGGKAVKQGNVEDLLSRGEGRKRIIVRGREKALQDFLATIGEEHQVISISEEFGQVTVVLINRQGSDRVFQLARSKGVQVRSYLPDRMTLEDLFIDTVREVR